MVNVAVMQQKNTCHDNLFFQNDETSSMAKSRPPTGAPKADAIPAAAPALIKFLLSSELRNLKKQSCGHMSVTTIINRFLHNANYLMPYLEKHGRLHSKVADLN